MRKSFWGEALSTVVHLINRTPSFAINFTCPEEKWIGRILDLSYLRVFGCEAFAHVSKGKLEPRDVKCVFLGYHEGTKGYRLWEKRLAVLKLLSVVMLSPMKLCFLVRLTLVQIQA